MGGVKRIEHNNKILAIVIQSAIFHEMNKRNKELEFVTPNEFPFQIGAHNWQKGKIIKEHFHLPFEKLEKPKRESKYATVTQEEFHEPAEAEEAYEDTENFGEE